jgi:hypothetical protein
MIEAGARIVEKSSANRRGREFGVDRIVID